MRLSANNPAYFELVGRPSVKTQFTYQAPVNIASDIPVTLRGMVDLNKIIRESHLYCRTVGCPGTTHHAGMRPKEPLGLQHAITDSDGIYALETLATGEIKGWNDIESAEIALRAFILHDRVDWLLPAVLVTRGKTTTNFFPEPRKVEAISKVIRSSNTFHRTVYASRAVIMPGNMLYADKFWIDNYPEVMYRPENLPKGAIDSAFKSYLETDLYKTAFVATPARLGAPSYFTDRGLRAHEAKIHSQNGTAPTWLNPLDLEWNKKLEIMKKAGINIRIGPFLSIVLSRAEKRSDIPAAIIELREEMQQPRHDLWALFDEVKNETSFHKSIQKIESIEKAAQNIVPAAYPDKASPLRFIWNAVKNASALGAVVSTCDYFLEKDVHWQQVSTVDAAQVITKRLREVEGL